MTFNPYDAILIGGQSRTMEDGPLIMVYRPASIVFRSYSYGK